VDMALRPGKVPLIVAAMCAPLTATSLRWPGVYHAVDMGEVIRFYRDGGTVAAPCGARRLRPLAYGADQLLVLWPVRVKGLPEGWQRCRDCHDLTGRKSPRSTFKSAVPTAS
jgi:hypothetical protein